MSDSARGSGPKGGSGGTGGRPAEPAPGIPEDTGPPGQREVPTPGTPANRETQRRLKEEAQKPAPPRPPGQADRG